MKSLSSSIPISRRIQPSVFAALVTAVVMCIFPLMERFSENTQQPIVHSQPLPVKIAQFPPEASVSTIQQAVKSQAQSRRQLAPIALPPALVPPKKIPHITLPPKALPIITPSVQETPILTQPVELPPVVATQEAPPPAAETPTTTATTTNDIQSAETQQGNVVSDMPDGKSLKHPPIPLKSVQPRYPEYSRRLNLEGFVILRFIVDINGYVSEASVLQSSPAGQFDNAALRAIQQWRFSPGKDDNGTPVPCRLQLRIDFKLKDQY